jgi:hypothetical protein
MQAVTLFFETARDEVAGTTTLVGLLPDNIELEGVGVALLPKLVAFTRINMSVDDTVAPIDVSLRAPDGTIVVTNSVGVEKVEQAIADAKRDGNVIAGIVARIEAQPFIAARGRYLAVVTYAGEERVTGTIRFYGSIFGDAAAA